ncbi:hypothetical protein [Streptomyces sp. NPDC054784]
MDWREEKRRDLAAAADERRKDGEAADERRARQRREDAEFARAQRQADRDEKRKAKDARRKERKARRDARSRAWTPERLYGRSTYTIVAASALASLPAQFAHFGHISPMLLTIPIALEGAAWSTFAGVAYADERQLYPGVRWALRGLSMAFASFAAGINWLYGQSLADRIGEGEATTVAAALAAVTLLGPLLFETRQWVRTLSASARDPKKRAEEKARARHEKKRGKKFEAVAKRHKRILLAAPFGVVSTEDAWRQAWLDVEGAPPGVTAAVVAHRIAAESAVSVAAGSGERTPEQVAVDMLLADLFPALPGDDGDAGGSPKKGPQGGPRGGGGRGARTPGDGAAEDAGALGRKGKQRSGRSSQKTPQKPLDSEHIETVRQLAVLSGGADKLSARKVREVIGGGSNEYAVRLRDAVQNEAGGKS